MTMTPPVDGNPKKKQPKALATFLRHFIGVQLSVELKNGKIIRGNLSASDGDMNLMLEDVKSSSSLGLGLSTDQAVHTVHIRGSTIRYIHFPNDLPLATTVKNSLALERSASGKYQRRSISVALVEYFPKRPQSAIRVLGIVAEIVELNDAARMESVPSSRKARKKGLSERVESCGSCSASGLVPSDERVPANDRFPRVAIVGGGLAGWALAAACRHRGIPYDVFERDAHFIDRAQGYGLTMQQASKALKGFGIWKLEDGITSTKHIVHTADGTVVGQWGMRHWKQEDGEEEIKSSEGKKEPRRQNIHIARQSLRRQLLQVASGQEDIQNVNCDRIHWNYRLLNYEKLENKQVLLTFLNIKSGARVHHTADLVVGADGIRSQVREQLVGDSLRYLNCFVMLGICELLEIDRSQSELLDGKTVFQTADGTTRLYMMPYSSSAYMWQLSFPFSEKEMKLFEEARRRCSNWHNPIEFILKSTPSYLVSGYPVYDRAILSPSTLFMGDIGSLENIGDRVVTLIGDAAHPMSPFKGQGANQALLDALSLTKSIYRAASESGDKQEVIRKAIEAYEAEMLPRSAVKVKASAEAAEFLHTSVAIEPGDVTRGGASKRQKQE